MFHLFLVQWFINELNGWQVTNWMGAKVLFGAFWARNSTLSLLGRYWEIKGVDVYGGLREGKYEMKGGSIRSKGNSTSAEAASPAKRSVRAFKLCFFLTQQKRIQISRWINDGLWKPVKIKRKVPAPPCLHTACIFYLNKSFSYWTLQSHKQCCQSPLASL